VGLPKVYKSEIAYTVKTSISRCPINDGLPAGRVQLHMDAEGEGIVVPRVSPRSETKRIRLCSDRGGQSAEGQNEGAECKFHLDW